MKNFENLSGLLCWRDKCLLHWHVANSKHLKVLSELHINKAHFTHLRAGMWQLVKVSIATPHNNVKQDEWLNQSKIEHQSKTAQIRFLPTTERFNVLYWFKIPRIHDDNKGHVSEANWIQDVIKQLKSSSHHIGTFCGFLTQHRGYRKLCV